MTVIACADGDAEPAEMLSLPTTDTPTTTEALISRVMPVALARGGDDLRETFSTALKLAAEETGDAALRRGARAVRLGARGRGRPPLEGTEALLAEIAKRVAAGEPQDRVETDVATRVAAIDGVEVDTIKRRLNRARART
jgi:hypothetical protein